MGITCFTSAKSRSNSAKVSFNDAIFEVAINLDEANSRADYTQATLDGTLEVSSWLMMNPKGPKSTESVRVYALIGKESVQKEVIILVPIERVTDCPNFVLF